MSDFAERYAALALLRGLYVVRPDGSRVPIPVVLEPTVVDVGPFEEDAHVLVGAATRAAMRLPLEALGRPSPLERECLLARRGRGELPRLVTSRVDFIGGKALEINATIPAMQGYADIVCAAFFAALGAPADVGAQNGSNTDDLIDSLLAVAPSARKIAIVARAGDAQQGELLHYLARMNERGLSARLALPDEVRIASEAQGTLEVAGERVDLVYRHIFAWRLDPACDFARALVQAERFGIVNPVALDVEAKATLAELSRASDENEPWLSAKEHEVIRRRVPWTRRLDAASAARAEREQKDMVLKRSWDYGGKSVHLGIDTPPARWRELVHAALDPDDVWVVQERAPARTLRRTTAGRFERVVERVVEGVVEAVSAADCYVDLSAFTSSGISRRPRGGASRVARSRIVNILGGGGLAPVVRPEVARALGLAEVTPAPDASSSRASSS
jgi:hypothetical protein